MELDILDLNAMGPQESLRLRGKVKPLLRSFRPWSLSRQPCHAKCSSLSLEGNYVSSSLVKTKKGPRGGCWDFRSLLGNLPP